MKSLQSSFLYFLLMLPWSRVNSVPTAQIIADLVQGVGSSEPSAFTEIDGNLYFGAGLPGSRQAWVATSALDAVIPLPTVGDPVKFLKHIGKILIFTTEGLFAQDAGNLNYTIERLSNGYISDHSFIEYNGRVYFSQGLELWATDGTVEGTSMFVDLNSANAHPDFFNVFNDKLFFAAFTGDILDSEEELWYTDGTPEGTQMANFDPVDLHLNIYPPLVVNDKLLLVGTEAATGRELWTLNTDMELELLADISTGNSSSYIPIWGLLDSDRAVFLDGSEVWVTDGTPENTMMVHDFNEYIGWREYFTKYKERLYFVTDYSDSTSVYYTDGTATGSGKLIDTGEYSNPRHLVVSGDFLYFLASSALGETLLYQSDGTSAGTRVLEVVWPNDLSALGSVETDPHQDWLVEDMAMFDFDGRLVFSANNGTLGSEPWAIDVRGEEDLPPSLFEIIAQIIQLIIDILFPE